MSIQKLDDLLISDNEIIIPNKENAATIAASLRHKVFEEGFSPFTVCERFSFLKQVEEEFKTVEMVKYIRNEIEKNGKSGAQTSFGVKFTLLNRNDYDYSHDPIWKRYKDQEEHFAKLRKAREEMLKKLPQPNALKGIPCQIEVDTDTGEQFELRPPVAIPKVESFSTKLS